MNRNFVFIDSPVSGIIHQIKLKRCEVRLSQKHYSILRKEIFINEESFK